MLENIKELSSAMAKAFGSITGAAKDKKNAHLNYEYASLNSIIDAIRPAIAQHGLWFYQVIHTVPGCAAVETIIVHSSGEYLSCGIVTVPLSKNDAQGYGSGLTYAKKYSLSSAFAVAPEDEDDGEEASMPQQMHREAAKRASPAQAKEPLIPKEQLIEKLIQATGIKEEKFKEYLAYLEENMKSSNRSLHDALPDYIAYPARVLGPYNSWKTKQAVN